MASVASTNPRRSREKISERKAVQLSFKSSINGPIAERSLLEKSLFLAEVSLISYMTPTECNIAAGKLGFLEGNFFDGDGSQAYWFQNEHDSVVVCRGTEPNDWNDIRADTNALTALAETAGRVHRGFKREVDDLWPALEEALKSNTRKIWFTGHSLGGAMATICSGRCLLSHIRSEPSGLFTFGSPRVGNKRYIHYAKFPHYRWVNNNDIVARVPPFWFGYRHSGQELYLDRNGALNNITGLKRIADRIQGFYRELTTKFRVDHLSDHSIFRYIECIHGLIRDGHVAHSIYENRVENDAAES